MRLVCPNCEAKYEVPDDAIPDTGRDVQCANCGHAWFQMRPRSVEAAAVAVEPPSTAVVVEPPSPAVVEPVAVAAEDPRPETLPDDAPVIEPAVADATASESEELIPATSSDAAGEDTGVAGAPAAEPEVEDPEPVAAASTPAAAPAAYAVDDSVLAILREEAEREANARRAEVRPLETQPDLGIDAAPPAKPAVVETKLAAVEAEAKPSARRDLLPDVEEINSTLRPSEQMPDDEDGDGASATMPPPRRGFRSGFLTVMTLAILGAALYIIAPTLGANIPALAGPLDAYVDFVDSFRLQLDGLMRSATVAINGS